MCYFEEEEQLKEVHVVTLKSGEVIVFSSAYKAEAFGKENFNTIVSYQCLPIDPPIEKMWTVNFELHGEALKIFANKTEMPSRHTPGLFVSGDVGNWIVRVYAVNADTAIKAAKELLKGKL